jgi:TPR repeat protein
MYAEGTGTRTNPALAVKWWRKAAQKGDAKAQYNLGSSYADGCGVRTNKRLGAIWLKKAATHGHRKAARELRALESVLASR